MKSDSHGISSICLAVRIWRFPHFRKGMATVSYLTYSLPVVGAISVAASAAASNAWAVGDRQTDLRQRTAGSPYPKTQSRCRGCCMPALAGHSDICLAASSVQFRCVAKSWLITADQRSISIRPMAGAKAFSMFVSSNPASFLPCRLSDRWMRSSRSAFSALSWARMRFMSAFVPGSVGLCGICLLRC